MAPSLSDHLRKTQVTATWIKIAMAYKAANSSGGKGGQLLQPTELPEGRPRVGGCEMRAYRQTESENVAQNLQMASVGSHPDLHLHPASVFLAAALGGGGEGTNGHLGGTTMQAVRLLVLHGSIQEPIWHLSSLPGCPTSSDGQQSC